MSSDGSGNTSDLIRLDWRVALTLMVSALALHVLAWVLLPFLLAVIVAFVCEPLVRSLARRTGMPRWSAGAGIWFVLFAMGLAIAAAASLSAVDEISRLAHRGPDLFRETLTRLLGPKGVQVFGVPVTPDEVAGELKVDVGAGLKLGSATKFGSAVVAAAVGVVLFAASSFYTMLSGPQIARGALWLVPPSQRPALKRLLPEMLATLRRFYVGVFLIVVFTALAAWIGYGLLLHVPDALLLALGLGVLETIPAVGPMASAAIVGVIALQLHNLATMAFMVGYAIALRFVIDDLVAPLVLGRSVAIHPVVVMLAYSLGAVLFGVTGLLLAVPAAACIRLWLKAAYGDTPAQTV